MTGPCHWLFRKRERKSNKISSRVSFTTYSGGFLRCRANTTREHKTQRRRRWVCSRVHADVALHVCTVQIRIRSACGGPCSSGASREVLHKDAHPIAILSNNVGTRRAPMRCQSPAWRASVFIAGCGPTGSVGAWRMRSPATGRGGPQRGSPYPAAVAVRMAAASSWSLARLPAIALSRQAIVTRNSNLRTASTGSE